MVRAQANGGGRMKAFAVRYVCCARGSIKLPLREFYWERAVFY